MSGEAPNNTGIRPLPGPVSRNPLLISGNIVETGGARSLYVGGPGLMILTGTNTYTGGTKVGFRLNPATGANQNFQVGSLVFGSASAVPATGSILSGQTNLNGAHGYVGIATSAVPNAGDFANFLLKFDPTSSGAVGLDSLTAGLPSGSPSTFTDNINLTGFTTTAFEGIRLGTATSVTLTGSITPQLTANYNFGNGGGKLYVASALVNHTTSTYVATNNGGVALMLYLKGANTYTGGTYANNGFIIFDGASSIPASGILRAGGAAANVGQSYIGFTDTTLGGTAVNGATLLSGLFTKFDKPNTWGVIGFDSTNVGTPTTVTNLDLTGFNNGVFVGTTTKAVLTGGIATTTELSGGNASDTYRFTAADGGTLVVDATLFDGAGARSVMIGVPGGFTKMADGTVVLSAANNYTGGTTINGFGGITLAGATDTSFGTGTITLMSQPNQNGTIGLSATTAGRTFANQIDFAVPGTGITPQLFFTGSNSFTLSGNITGPAAGNSTGVGAVFLTNPTPINVTLSGDNTGYNGGWIVQNGTLTFASANAAGHGTLQLDSDDATAAFTTSGTLYGIVGTNGGHLHLNNGINLTFDTSTVDGTYEFGGAITAPGNVSTTASLQVTATTGGETLYLYGNNQYSGGTNITGHGALGLGANSSAGTGTITINATNGDGGLILNDSVTLTNALVLTQGALAGLGTFAPTSFNGTPGAPITIGPLQSLFPGIPDSFFPGELTLSGNTVFNNGGSYIWGLQDASFAEGSGSLYITGNLDLSSVSVASFNLLLESYDAFGDEGLAAGITMGNSYQFLLIETGGTISGFSADKFLIDSSLFQNNLFPTSAFTLTADSQHIYLNFQAVPEPSTYALLALGSGWVAFALRRRRQA
jgi:autotransporter-associated beta strand protein